VNKNKDKTLFIYEGHRLSYASVDKRVNRTANALKKLGTSKNDRIAVMLPNGFEFPVVWLAIAKLLHSEVA
jgi:acyl-coenzyme A synthetase/AMP-(fatty) acid ligase